MNASSSSAVAAGESSTDPITTEIARGERFRFGENWRAFLATLTEERIATAERSLQQMLEVERLDGRSFLDAGSGSGLFSLAARRLGARVLSFDFDPASVACAEELRRRYYPDDPSWGVRRGSVLDAEFLASVGTFDIVYSWGVLHHTGAMWKALDLIAMAVKPGGRLFIALYNDQGRKSRWWLAVKRAYCALPAPLQRLVQPPIVLGMWGPTLVSDLVRLRPLRRWREYHRERGMSPWHDVVDWVGGLPFEVARPDDIFRFYRDRGFTLRQLTTTGGLGNNEYVFEKGTSDRRHDGLRGAPGQTAGAVDPR